jgi:hypothetical protein
LPVTGGVSYIDYDQRDMTNNVPAGHSLGEHRADEALM